MGAAWGGGGAGDHCAKQLQHPEPWAQVADTVAEIQERHEAVKELEKSLLDLHQIFLVRAKQTAAPSVNCCECMLLLRCFSPEACREPPAALQLAPLWVHASRILLRAAAV